MTIADRMREMAAHRDTRRMREHHHDSHRYTLHDESGVCVSHYLDNGEPCKYFGWELEGACDVLRRLGVTAARRRIESGADE